MHDIDGLIPLKYSVLEEMQALRESIQDMNVSYDMEHSRVTWEYLRGNLRKILYTELLLPWLKAREDAVSALDFSGINTNLEDSLRGKVVPLDSDTAFDMGSFDLDAFGYIFTIGCFGSSDQEGWQLRIERIAKAKVAIQA